jgi:hypothetical protein
MVRVRIRVRVRVRVRVKGFHAAERWDGGRKGGVLRCGERVRDSIKGWLQRLCDDQ